jgi:hypothetical protein
VQKLKPASHDVGLLDLSGIGQEVNEAEAGTAQSNGDATAQSSGDGSDVKEVDPENLNELLALQAQANAMVLAMASLQASIEIENQVSSR